MNDFVYDLSTRSTQTNNIPSSFEDWDSQMYPTQEQN